LSKNHSKDKMKFLYLIIFSVFFISCKDQEVKIPVNDNAGPNEIWDNSRIYVLFKKEGNDTLADLKLGQAITTTHWLTAVDRRLKLKHLDEAFRKIIKKRHKKSLHSKEGTHAYFAYLDSLRKKMAFIDFDSLQFMPDYFTSETYFKKYSKDDKDFTKYHLYFFQKQIILNDTIKLTGLNKKQIIDSINQVIKNEKIDTANRLYLNFDSEVYYDRFLDYYTFFKNNPVKKGKLSPKIFIFTP